jgi:cytosine/adenosine deaminase-related metal-dependent hydrolase
VQHIHGWMPGTLAEVEGKSAEVVRAYEDVGMRVSYCYAVRDQNRLVYQADAEFIASLPAELQEPMRRWFARFKTDLDDSMGLFRSLHARHNNKRRVKIQLAPANLHWCSDRALTALSETSKAYDVPMHMHLLETAYQKEYAWRRGKCTALEYIDRFDMVNPRLTLGHGVWLNESDIERMAAAGACVCHNCSSNLRLRSGVAALNRFEQAGLNTAIGLDEAGINDDRDMLQELRMATTGGAKTTPFAADIGTLEVGKAADLTIFDPDTVEPLPLQTLDDIPGGGTRMTKGAKSINWVIVGGDTIIEDGKPTDATPGRVLASPATG